MRCYLIAGHGDGDIGATGVFGRREADYTRELVERISEYTGFDHLNFDINAYTDTDKALKSIPAGTELVVEIHFNAFTDDNARGTEIWLPSNYQSLYEHVPSDKLCETISKAINTVNRGVKYSNFKVISKIASWGIPAILVEVCFITSLWDMDRYSHNKAAIAIGDTLMDKPKEPWYSEYAKLCDELGIITGKRYGDYVTRAEMTKIVARILEVVEHAKKT